MDFIISISEIIKSIFISAYSIVSAVAIPIHDIIEKYYINNPMYKVVLAFVPGLLGMAYPLFIQTIGRLNDQYKSTHITEQFKNEIYHNLFIWNLRISVTLSVLCFILSLFVFVLSFVSVIILLIVFFFYLNTLMNYQNVKDLFILYNNRLKIDNNITHRDIRKKIQKEKEKILKYWHAIIDLYLYSVRNNDRKLENDIRDLFMYRAFNFIKYSDQGDVETVLFPSEMYNSTFDIVYTYLNRNEKDYYQNIAIFVGPIFFSESYGKLKPQYLHQDTLFAIWRNLVLLVEHDRGDKILEYWQAAHQYCNYKLESPRLEYDDDYNETPASIEKRKKVLKYQDDFIQLHTALGAYLMYKKNCKTLKEIWFFTQSQPPIYVLIPQTPNSIFGYFFKYLFYEYYNLDTLIGFRFRDVDFDEMNNKRDVKHIICEYLVLLFLRLYITTGFYGTHPIHFFPQIPVDQAEKKKWEEMLDVFRRILERHLEDSELMQCLGLSKITKDNCKISNFPFPLDYIDELKQKVEEGFVNTIEESELDANKINLLDQNTVNSIVKVFNDVSRIKGADVTKENRDSVSENMEAIRGTIMLLDKEAFMSNTSVHHLNSDSIIGETIANQYYYHFASKISLQGKLRKYKVPYGQTFEAINKLYPSPDVYIIVTFGINIKYLRDYKKIAINEPIGDEDYTYNTIPIYCFDFGYSPIHQTTFLIKKIDRPMIKHKDWTEIENLTDSIREKWGSMEKINEDLNIYRKITDLNRDESSREKYIKQGNNIEELKNKVEIDVDFLAYVWFKSNVKIIEIQEIEMFQEGGAQDKIEDIEPLK